MDVFTLFKRLKRQDEMLLLDVRENSELLISSIPQALHIPMGNIVDALNKIPKDVDVVVLCHHGIRSQMVVNYMVKSGYKRVYNLEGGIDKWAHEVDKSMMRY